MKNSMKLMAAAALFTFAAAANAQVVSSQNSGVGSVVTSDTKPETKEALTNEQLSEQYKLRINVINSEIKTLKAQAKLYKTDPAKSAEVASLMGSKKAELTKVKAEKAIVDKAIKTEKASKKAAEKAEKARKAAEAAAAKAEKLQ